MALSRVLLDAGFRVSVVAQLLGHASGNHQDALDAARSTADRVNAGRCTLGRPYLIRTLGASPMVRLAVALAVDCPHLELIELADRFAGAFEEPSRSPTLSGAWGLVNWVEVEEGEDAARENGAVKYLKRATGCGRVMLVPTCEDHGEDMAQRRVLRCEEVLCRSCLLKLMRAMRCLGHEALFYGQLATAKNERQSMLKNRWRVLDIRGVKHEQLPVIKRSLFRFLSPQSSPEDPQKLVKKADWLATTIQEDAETVTLRLVSASPSAHHMFACVNRGDRWQPRECRPDETFEVETWTCGGSNVYHNLSGALNSILEGHLSTHALLRDLVERKDQRAVKWLEDRRRVRIVSVSGYCKTKWPTRAECREWRKQQAQAAALERGELPPEPKCSDRCRESARLGFEVRDKSSGAVVGKSCQYPPSYDQAVAMLDKAGGLDPKAQLKTPKPSSCGVENANPPDPLAGYSIRHYPARRE